MNDNIYSKNINMMTWNEYVKCQRIKLNKKRKREKLEPLTYKETLKICSTTWPAEKERLCKKAKRMERKLCKLKEV